MKYISTPQRPTAPQKPSLSQETKDVDSSIWQRYKMLSGETSQKESNVAPAAIENNTKDAQKAPANGLGAIIQSYKDNNQNRSKMRTITIGQ